MYLTRPSLSLPKPPDANFAAALLAVTEERLTKKGDVTGTDPQEALGTQSSPELV